MSQINNNRRSTFWLFMPIYVVFMSLNEENFKITLLKLVNDLKVNVLLEPTIRDILISFKKEITDNFRVDAKTYQFLEYWLIHSLCDEEQYQFLQPIESTISHNIINQIEVDKFKILMNDYGKPELKYLYD